MDHRLEKIMLINATCNGRSYAVFRSDKELEFGVRSLKSGMSIAKVTFAVQRLYGNHLDNFDPSGFEATRVIDKDTGKPSLDYQLFSNLVEIARDHMMPDKPEPLNVSYMINSANDYDSKRKNYMYLSLSFWLEYGPRWKPDLQLVLPNEGYQKVIETI